MRTLLVCLVLSAAAQAQYPISANGLLWTGPSGSAGTFCWGFSCTPAAAQVLPGETGTLTVRAEFGQSFIIGASATATRCLSFPNFFNSLVLDDPIVPWITGICDQQSPILACPSGTHDIPISIPAFIPPGVTLSLQGVTSIPHGTPGTPSWSFTQAITFTVL